MDFVELACYSAALVRLVRKKKKRRRKFWVHPEIISQRFHKGQFYKINEDLRRDPAKFYDYFKMSAVAFDKLLTIVAPRITKQTTVMRQPISPDERLAVTLRYLTTGNSFSSLHTEYLLGVSTISKIVKKTCEALWELLPPMYLHPKTTQEWNEVAQQFYKTTKFPNCVGAIGGKHIRILNASHSESMFFNHEKFSSLVILGLADTNYRFTAIDVSPYGSSTGSDSNVFKNSILGQMVESNQMNFPAPEKLPNDGDGTPMPHVIAGDEAFALSKNVMRPYQKRDITADKKVFNSRLSNARRTVECAFRMLVNKWQVFDQAMKVDIDFAQLIVQTSCVLQNFVIEEDDFNFEDILYECPLETVSQRGLRSDRDGTSNREYLMEYFGSERGSIPCQSDKV